MKLKLKDLMVGEDFVFKNNKEIPPSLVFCYIGRNEDNDAIIVKNDYMGPNAQGNSVYSESLDSEIEFVPRKKYNR